MTANEPSTLFENCLRSLTSAFVRLDLIGNSPKHENEANQCLAVYGNICDNLACSNLTDEERDELLEALRANHHKSLESDIVNLKTADLGTTSLLKALMSAKAE